ncbi:MAG: ABC transporter ATP-binding protein [Chloroflexi bacterium]|nr:ABC transporter ATP-binding protein [Chloroflexota bacterium]
MFERRTYDALEAPRDGWRFRVYRRILSHMLRFWPGIGTALTFTLFSSLLATLTPWPVKFLIDGVLVGDVLRLPFGIDFSTDSTGERITATALLSLAYVLTTGGSAVLASLSFYVVARTALVMIHTLRTTLIEHMRGLSLRWHASQSLGDMIWRGINDARAIQEVLLYGIRSWGTLGFRVALMVAFMAVLDPLLTLVAMGVMPFLVFTIRAFTGRIQNTSLVSREWMSRLTAMIEESMASIRAVKVFGREGTEQSRFEETSHSFVKAQLRFRLAEQLLFGSTVVITGVGTGFVLGIAAVRVNAGDLSVGSLWIFMSYMQSLYQMINEIMISYGPFQDAVVGVGRAFEVLDEVSDIQDDPQAVPVTRFENGIKFEDVHFEYEPGRPVLRGVNLGIRPGEKVAIVGATGSGKTTLLMLIPRLYDVTGGSITIDGIDARGIKVTSMRELIAMAPQEVQLFSTTVRENILYGRLDASQEEVVAAAQAARALLPAVPPAAGGRRDRIPAHLEEGPFHKGGRILGSRRPLGEG